MANPLLCVTVTATTMADLRSRRDAAARQADLVELRLDGVRDADVAGALAGRATPVVLTCRSRREGGVFDGDEAERLAILRRAAAAGAEFVDVEWSADHGSVLAVRGGRGIVLSSHDFTGVPADLGDRCRAMRATGAEVVKLAVTAHSLSDMLPLLDLAATTGDHAGRMVVLAMGLEGLPSRVLAARFGSAWSYAGAGVAPGQVPPERMLGEFGFHQISRATKVYGVVGKPIGHSISPAIHNAAFREVGADAVYLPLAAADAADFRRFAAAIGLAGASVTAPFKRDLADGAACPPDDPGAALGVVNTLKATEGGWAARNTDVAGFLAPLDARGVALAGRRAAILGAGGAARAAACALLGRGASVTLHGRDEGRVRDASLAVPGASVTTSAPSPGTWDLLVNATPVGTAPEAARSPLPASALVGGAVVYDLVYNPAVTRLLDDATKAGCRTIGGLEMLVAQAVAQFEWWTGRPAPVEAMRAAAVRRLAECQAEGTGTR